jgi:hypothetical protein
MQFAHCGESGLKSAPTMPTHVISGRFYQSYLTITTGADDTIRTSEKHSTPAWGACAGIYDEAKVDSPMAMNRIKTGLLACGIQLLLVASAAAQTTETDFAPSVGDVQLFDQAEVSDYGGGPDVNEGWFGSFDYLNWWVDAPDKHLIGENYARQVSQDGYNFFEQPNSLDTGFIESGPTGGNRVEFGYVEEDRGWLFSGYGLQNDTQTLIATNVGVSFVDQFPSGFSNLSGFVDYRLTDGFDDDIDFDQIHGRDGVDIDIPPDGIPNLPVGAPPDFGDLVPLPVFFDDVKVRSSSKASSFEVMRLWRVNRTKSGGVVELFAGVRYFNFADEFSFQGVNEHRLPEFIGPGPRGLQEISMGTLGDALIFSESDNNLVGPQFGLRWTARKGRLTFGTQGRFFAAANFQSVRQQGVLGDHVQVSGPNYPLDFATTHFNHTFHATEFSPSAELRAEFSYQVFRSVALKAGWTGTYTDNLARSSSMIYYNVPDMGIEGNNNRQELFMHGLNIGFEINR